jgi:hypothetical protein
MFSRSRNVIPYHGTREPAFKFPFSVHQGEVAVFAVNDVRIGGWGVLFGGIILCSALLYYLSGSWKNSEMAAGLIFLLCIVVINPGSWWARYAPQVALAPLLMAIPPAGSQQDWKRISARFIFILLLLNAFLILVPNTRYTLETSEAMKQSIDNIVKNCGTGTYEISDTEHYHFEQFLGQNGINIVYPREDIKKTLSQNQLFPLENPVERVFLHKEGCIRGARN